MTVMRRRSSISVSVATPGDAPRIVTLATSVAEELTRCHGRGHWSLCPTEAEVLRKISMTRFLVARCGAEILGTVLLQTKKPWAIDVSYFTGVPRALYLLDLAVAPQVQRKGIGRRLIEEAMSVAQAWPSHAIRLDAYDHPAGAGPFYRKCGFREVGRVVFRGVPLVYFEVVF
jgi:ribosomal protein S18 acetylase RimI-like enzyme